jgi:hypothetical protein
VMSQSSFWRVQVRGLARIRAYERLAALWSESGVEKAVGAAAFAEAILAPAPPRGAPLLAAGDDRGAAGAMSAAPAALQLQHAAPYLERLDAVTRFWILCGARCWRQALDAAGAAGERVRVHLLGHVARECSEPDLAADARAAAAALMALVAATR